MRASRWDPKRDLRLGWNVVRGDRDAELSLRARERIERFRAQRLGWIEAMHASVRGVRARRLERWARSEGRTGSARAGAQQLVFRRLLARLNAFLDEDPATHADDSGIRRSARRSDLESCEDDDRRKREDPERRGSSRSRIRSGRRGGRPRRRVSALVRAGRISSVRGTA